MAVNLSPVGGAAAQFFTNTGAVLTGGKLFTYLAGTTTPAITYTTSAGNVARTNPIILDAAGRVPGSGEIWLTSNIVYKFVLTDSNDVLIGTYDNISTQVSTDASLVTYTPAGTGAVTTTVQAKLRQTVSVKDFGAVGNGIANDTVAFTNAIAASNAIYVPQGTYLVDGSFNISNKFIYGDGDASTLQLSGNGLYESFFWNKPDGVTVAAWAAQTVFDFYAGFQVRDLRLVGTGSTPQTLPSYANWVDMPGLIWVSHGNFVDVDNVSFFDAKGHGVSQRSGGYSNISNCFFDYMSGNGVALWGRETSLDACTSYTIFDNGFREIDYYGVDCFACFGILILGNIFEKIDAGVRFGGTTAANTLCRSLRLIGNYLEVGPKGLLYRNPGADATFLTVVHNETDVLGNDGAGGPIQDFPPVLAFDNAVGSTRGWMYRSGGIAELLSQTARAQAFRGQTFDLIDSFNTSFGQLAPAGSYLNARLRFALDNADTQNSVLIEDEFGSYQVRFVRGNQTPFGAGANGADTFMWIQADLTTGRSINAAGTINASGADYAEYENNGGLTIEKGAVVGFKSDGNLTLTYSEAVRFGIKSTNPSYVGGDVWGKDVGPRPEASPREIDETKQEYAIRCKEFDANDVALKAWKIALEEKRQTVDRIAYSGKVPVNIANASAGGYVIADQNSVGQIIGVFVQDPDFGQYKKAVGRVNRIISTEQVEVAVIVH
jgi:hypothetical protein